MSEEKKKNPWAGWLSMIFSRKTLLFLCAMVGVWGQYGFGPEFVNALVAGLGGIAILNTGEDMAKKRANGGS